MTSSSGQVSGSAAEIYEQFFVPALFGEWAPRVADALAVEPAHEVLDVACGTGVVAREVARRIGAGRVRAIDCNDGMLAVARTLAPGVDWRVARAEALPFDDARFDAVACSFGLMFFGEPHRALAEMWRVLRPGGTLAVAVWDSLTATPGYAAMVELLADLFGDDIAAELRAPFSLGEPGALEALLAQVGIDATIDTVVGTARFPSIAAWVHTDIRGWTLADRIDDAQLAQLRAAAEVRLAPFTATGAVVFDSPALLAVAHKP